MMKTSITRLDDLLGGGLPERANILLTGPPALAKDALLMQFLRAGKGGEPGVFISTDAAPSEVEKKAISFGMDFAGAVKFVDCYSWTLQARPAGRSDIMVPGPSALNELSIAISRSLSEAGRPGVPTRVSFQSLSTLILYNNPEIVFRFIQVMGARLKSSGATTIFSLDEGMHDARVLTTLEHLTDGTIAFKIDGGRGFLSVPRMPLSRPIPDWLEFDATPTGIAMK